MSKCLPFGSRTKQNYTPIAAIREKCRDCIGYENKEIAECGIQSCSLWEYRFGERPETAVRKGKNVVRGPKGPNGLYPYIEEQPKTGASPALKPKDSETLLKIAS